jgi:hypothetical protein
MSLGTPLVRSSPEAQGISSIAIADFISTAEKTIHSLHSFMLLRHGKVVAEGWWYPWRSDVPHMLFSLSKSFATTAVGLAIDEGRLTLDDQVLSFFPNESPRKITQHLADMKIHHLLTMTTGHDRDTVEDVFFSHTPVKTFLALPVEHSPGTHFLYNTGASFIVSAILQKLTGETLLVYLTPRLFEPLGITGASWDIHPVGINYGGMGLNIKTEDIARFGQLYLQRGIWNGRRILPEWWVDEATAKQVSNGNDPDSDWAQGYGYQFWRCRYNYYRADGAFGQFCIVMPDKQAVVVLTAGDADMQAILNLVWEKLLPTMRVFPESTGGENRPSVCMWNDLNIAPPLGEARSPLSSEISDVTYSFDPNYETLHHVNFYFDNETCRMTYRLLGGGKRRGIHHLEIGYCKWLDGISYLGDFTPHKVAASGAWTAQNTFTVTMCFYETPFILTLTCRFESNRIFYNCKSNVGFGPLERPQLVGIGRHSDVKCAR